MMIRVIAGSQKGRKLFGPKGHEFRPTTGRVKEFIFSYFGPDIQDAVVLDLFSGSGSLGIEALSRGAKHVTFVESDPLSVQTLNRNLELCGFIDRCEIRRENVFQTIEHLHLLGRTYHLVLADPPFKASYHRQIVDHLSKYPILSEEGEAIIEHEIHDQIDSFGTLEQIRQKKCGHCVVSIYRLC